MAIFTLFALGYALVISIALRQLMHGGIYLQYEKESDAIELYGEITDIRGLELFSFPIVEGGYKHEEKMPMSLLLKVLERMLNQLNEKKSTLMI